ncbi:phage repressor protein CI [Morganella morganii]|uniref:phage repressor protein CI n=1 Tax=Morganella morganii TaxID=582 RepID=UPI003CFE43B5
MKLETGARPVIDRVCEAYGFTSKSQLADHIGISKGSLGNRLTRDNFPHDIVLRCIIETGASPEWLSFGTGKAFNTAATDIAHLDTFNLVDGKLQLSIPTMFDKVMLPNEYHKIEIINYLSDSYFIERRFSSIDEGKWLVEFSGKCSFNDLQLIPGNKIRMDGGKYPIDCAPEDIKAIGKVIAVYARQQ